MNAPEFNQFSLSPKILKKLLFTYIFDRGIIYLKNIVATLYNQTERENTSEKL